MDRKKFLKITSISAAGLGYGYQLSSNQSTIFNGDTLPPLLTDANGNKIINLEQWKHQRQIIKDRYSDYLGILDSNPKKPTLSIIKEENARGIIRQLVEYEGEPGLKVKGYLLKPENLSNPAPAVVAMHSTNDGEMLYIAGVKKGNWTSFGYNLAKCGFVVFCPQCFLKWYENKSVSAIEEVKKFHERHPKSKGMAKMLFDAQRAVDVLELLDFVDSNRIGAIGHSLGGKEVFYLGAFDERVKTIVSSEGGIGIDFSNWDAIWYLDKEIHDFPYKHHEILALVAPRNFLLVGGDGYDGEKSRPYIEAVKSVWDLYGPKKGVIELLSHGQGHSVPADAEKYTYQWMNKYL